MHQMILKLHSPCNFGNTISYTNTDEVKQHLSWIVLGWEMAWELQVLQTKNKAGLCCRTCKQSRWATNSFKKYSLWKRMDCAPNSLLDTAAKRSTRVLAT